MFTAALIMLIGAACVVLILSASAGGADDDPPLSRRTCLRLIVLGATGLSVMPGCFRRRGATVMCYKPTTADADENPRDDSLLGRWARLGDVWREMTRHRKTPEEPFEKGKAAFDKLRQEMDTALDALPAWPELRAVYEQRWEHIARSNYSMVSCYEMVMGGMPAARDEVEKQVQELGKLVEEGKLSKEAASKAAAVLAIQAEYMARYQAAQGLGDPEERNHGVGLATRDYDEDKVLPGYGAELAGKRLVELTVDDVGYLAGPPQEDEGRPMVTCYAPPPPPAPEAPGPSDQ
jgi:hypothetical protein